MPLELKPPLPPMEAQLVDEIPTGADWLYEPKWDGFRCLIFRDGPDVYLQSKAGQPLARYFPEVVAVVEQLPAKQFVLDAEIVIPVGDSLSFDDLLLRLHPAASRVRKLAAESPAQLLIFDLLAEDRGRPLLEQPLAERRPRLEQFAAKQFAGQSMLHLSPATPEVDQARKWFEQRGGALDGIIAKRLDLPYRSGDRTGMQKVKKVRTVDCVVGGYRYGSKSKSVGSLLLGLYDDAGLLHHVGFTSGLKAAERPALTKKVEALRRPPGFTGRAPGGPSRWSTERSSEWEPLAPELVVEVGYDHFTGGRFRHGTKLLRWRPDKAPRQCTMEQVKRQGSFSLAAFASTEK